MRLIDMLLADKVVHWAGYSDQLPFAPRFKIDNVTRYYYEGDPKERWEVGDFPNLAPPFAQWWMEWLSPLRIVSDVMGTTDLTAAPRMAHGVHFVAHDWDEGERPPLVKLVNTIHLDAAKNVRWEIVCIPYTRWADGSELAEMPQPRITWIMGIDRDGVCPYYTPDEAIFEATIQQGTSYADVPRLMQMVSGLLHPALLAVSLMHCRNAVLDANDLHTPDAGVPTR